MPIPRPRIALVTCLCVVLFAALTAHGQALPSVVVSPTTVSAFPTQTTQSIAVTLTFSAPVKGGAGSMTATGMPAGVTTVPSPITYNAAAGATTASTSFAFSIAAGTTPGSYPVTVTDATNRAGSATVTLVVNAPTYTASASPNPLTLTIGGASQQVVVSTNPNPGFNSSTITYSFSGLPAFITNDGPKTTTVTGNYGPVTFLFSLAGGAVAGTYPGTLTGTNALGAPTNFPFTVVVQQPDIAASFTQPVVQICNGQTATDTLQLSPVNGYSGSPSLTFTSVPAGITIAPIPSVKMPPAVSIPINISASGASSGIAVLNISDPAAGINKNIQLQINVVNPDFTPAVTPLSVSLTAGGASQNVTANATPNACFSGNVSVTASGQPAGMSISPNPSTIVPGAGVPISIQASAATPPGTYPVTFTFSAAGLTKSVTVQVGVSAAPDFVLSINPAALTIPAGSSAVTSATITAVNGFTGTATVTAPITAGVTFTPASFALSAGGTQQVSIVVAATAAPGLRALAFTATAPGISGTRTAPLSLTISSGPDFTLAVNPAAATVGAGGTVGATVTVTPVGGFTGAVNVVAPTVPGVTITPSSFTIVPGSAGVAVSIVVDPSVQPQVFSLTFTGASVAGAATHTATLALTVTSPPGFMLTLTPDSLTIPAGGSADVTAAIVPLNGFNGTVTVTAPVVPGVTFNPSTFTLAPGERRVVTIVVDPSAPAGPRGPQTFSASSPGITNAAGAALSVTVSARPDFSIAADPTSLTIRSGGSGVVTLSATAVNGFIGSIAVATPTIAGLTFVPTSLMLTPGFPQQITIRATSSAATASPQQVVFTATASNPTITHTAGVVVTVLPPPPTLVAATPSSLVAGSRSIVIRVAGDFLQRGAQFHSTDPSVAVESSNVLSAQLADVQLTVRNGATPGPRELTVTNPDGGTSATPLIVLVYPTSSIAAPLDVTAAAIVYPARGSMLAPTDAVYPRGLLATTGTGTIIGSWQFDGVPFDRFVVNAAGGMPVEVRTNVPIPTSFAGSHTLAMSIESPRHFVSPAIDVIDSADRASRLTLLAPRDGAILRGTAQLFRWSLVPNCGGYDVEVALPGMSSTPDPLTPILRFHVANAEWHPSAADLADIGPGIHRWRVRPRCAGETELEPSPWQRFAILPDHVALSLLPMTTNERGHRVVRWNGGIAGLLYRVEFLSPAGDVIFSALTSATEYALPQNLPEGTSVRVSALAPDGSTLGTSSSSPLSRGNGREAIQLAQQTVIELGDVEPVDASTVAQTQPHIAAKWKGAAPADQVMLLVDNTDMTQVATITPTSISYDSLIALAPGSHTVAVSVAGNIKRWTFNVAGPPGAPAEAATAPAASPVEQPRGDWVIAPIGTITVVSAATHEARTQLSGLTDLNGDALTNKATGDVSVRHDFKEDKTVQESRNWVTDFGAHQGTNLTEALRVGFSQPSFFDQAQFLNAGVPRGGVQAQIATSVGTASYYQTFTSHTSGVVSGMFGPEQELKAAAYETPANDKWGFRLFGMRVGEAPAENSSGGVGHAAGIFGRYSIGATVTAIVEAARGDFKPSDELTDARRLGNAYRLGLTGMRGTVNYAFNLRHTDGEFINPANRGFTPGGVPDRTGGDFSIGKLIGTTSLNVQLQHMQDGTSPAPGAARTRQSGGMVSLMKMFGQHVSLALSGNGTRDRGDASAEFALPRTERNQSGATGTLTELFGQYNFSQTVSRQMTRDHINDLSNQTTTATTLTGGGQLATYFNLAAVVSGTRSAGSSIVGTTDQLLASLQPTITIPVLSVTLQPRASYSTSKNDLLASKTTTEQYQALVTFGPQWLGSLFAVQLSADWSRNRVAGELTPTPFVHRYAGTFNLHWRAGAGPAYTAGALAPGMLPVAAPNPAVSAPGATK